MQYRTLPLRKRHLILTKNFDQRKTFVKRLQRQLEHDQLHAESFHTNFSRQFDFGNLYPT